MEDDILKNANESLESAEDDLKKNRFNSAIASFFRTIANLCDYIIYKEIKVLPKNHGDRFNLLEKYFPSIHVKVKEIFEIYRDSYNIRLSKKDALKVRNYTYELKNKIN
jgi:hypothetical protein